jgi:hypothetical protein
MMGGKVWVHSFRRLLLAACFLALLTGYPLARLLASNVAHYRILQALVAESHASGAPLSLPWPGEGARSQALRYALSGQAEERPAVPLPSDALFLLHVAAGDARSGAFAPALEILDQLAMRYPESQAVRQQMQSTLQAAALARLKAADLAGHMFGISMSLGTNTIVSILTWEPRFRSGS